MDKKTLGGFMAALRRADGMTQQELADRLHVSNKSVSRWENDESTPDLSLIPVIAEIYGVTADELLRGERIPKEYTDAPRIKVKVEQQTRWLADNAVRKFRNMAIVSVMLLLAGYILWFGFRVGYRPISPAVGWMLLLLCWMWSGVLQLISYFIVKARIKSVDDIQPLVYGTARTRLLKTTRILLHIDLVLFLAGILFVYLSAVMSSWLSSGVPKAENVITYLLNILRILKRGVYFPYGIWFLILLSGFCLIFILFNWWFDRRSRLYTDKPKRKKRMRFLHLGIVVLLAGYAVLFSFLGQVGLKYELRQQIIQLSKATHYTDITSFNAFNNGYQNYHPYYVSAGVKLADPPSDTSSYQDVSQSDYDIMPDFIKAGNYYVTDPQYDNISLIDQNKMTVYRWNYPSAANYNNLLNQKLPPQYPFWMPAAYLLPIAAYGIGRRILAGIG